MSKAQDFINLLEDKKDIKAAVRDIWSNAKIKFQNDLAVIQNWKELEKSKHDVYAKLRAAKLTDLVSVL